MFGIDLYEHMFYNDYITTESVRWKGGLMDRREDNCVKNLSKEEYREALISIFKGMESEEKLRFWYKYIRAIENGED